MASLTNLNIGSGGDVILDIDMAPFVGYPLTSGKLEATAVYVGSDLVTAPAPVTRANPFPVLNVSGSAILGQVFLASGPVFIGVNSGAVQILSGSVTLGSGGAGIGSVGVSSGQVSISSGLLGVSSGLIGILSGSVSVLSGNIGVSGSAQLLSGSAWIGVVEGVFNPVAAGPASGQSFAIQLDGSGNLKTVSMGGGTSSVTSGSVQVSGAVIVSGNVGVSGSVVLLSGSAAVGVMEGIFSPIPVGANSGQALPLQIDGSGDLKVLIVNPNISGNVGVSGSVVLLSGSANIGVTEAFFNPTGPQAPPSGTAIALQADGSGRLRVAAENIGISGLAQISSGGNIIGSIGSGGFNIGTVGVSGSIQILSGSSWLGVIEGVFNPVAVGPASGQPFSLQLDGSGNLKTVLVGLIITSVVSGSVQVSGIVGISGQVGILSGLVGVLSGSIGAQVSGAVIVSGNVGVSGSVQLLSGSAFIGVHEGVFSPVTVGPASGQAFPIQVDGSGNQKASIVNLQIVSGSVQVSGIVGVSGSINVLSGQIAVSSGLIGVLSGSIGAQVSGAVIVSGNVGISGLVQILSGSAIIGTVVVSGAFQVLSGSAILGQISLLSGNVLLQASSSGGKQLFQYDQSFISGVVIKSSPGQLFGFSVFNYSAASGAWLKIYDKATAPNAADGPTLRFFIPALDLQLRNSEIPRIVNFGDIGLQFNAGISFAITGQIANNDTTTLGGQFLTVWFFK